MRDSRQPVILIILSAVVVVGLAVSGFFIDSGGGGLVSPLWLSHALSLVAMLVTVLSLNYVNSNNFLFTSDSRLLYLPYMLAILAVPGCNELSIHHAAAFLTVWAVYYALMYVNSETHRLYYAFMAALVSSLSAMLLPPMLYTGAFLLLYCLWYRGQDAARLLLAFVSALILPWVYVAVWDYIFHPSSAFVDSLAAYGRSLVPSLPSFSGVGWKCMIYFVLLSVMGMRAVVEEQARYCFISIDAAMRLLQAGNLGINSFKNRAKAFDEDGEVLPNQRLQLKEVKLGQYVLDRIEMVTAEEMPAEIILNRSAMSQLGRYSIDKEKKHIVVEE